MHFALPPRKTSFPPPYARVSAHDSASKRRKQLQTLGYTVFGLVALYAVFKLLRSIASSSSKHGGYISHHGPISPDTDVVIVTLLDEKAMGKEYIRMIKANREDYARKHGYKTHYPSVEDYAQLVTPSPSSWTLVPALRHTLTLYPTTAYIWSLTPHALITNLDVSLHTHLFHNLTAQTLKDIPVVPPDSVIHTFAHLHPTSINLILTQDAHNLAPSSLILQNSLTRTPASPDQPRDTWTQFLLDAWFDPLYRAYAFERAETHALEHIVQWHPTILAKLALVEQYVLNSYAVESRHAEDELKKPDMLNQDAGRPRRKDVLWQPGDLVVNFVGCESDEKRDCETEMKEWLSKKWEKKTTLSESVDDV